MGYKEFKFQEIEKSIGNLELLKDLKDKKVPADFGVGLDERVFEYSWIFSRLSNNEAKMLDAGSTFNFKFVLENKQVKKKDLTIFTFHPETPSFPSMPKVTYKYGDLRKMEFQNESFDEVISQSTIEHIDMDNNIYGYDIDKNDDIKKKSYDFMLAVKEMERVLKPGGQLLLTFPYGKFKHYGFFQQFDKEMVDKILAFLATKGKAQSEFALYNKSGWNLATQSTCNNNLSFNPHTGEDKGTDGAAHSRSVCLIEFRKE